MASSSRLDYEIITDPFDPRCVIACFKSTIGQMTKKDKLLLERIRGKEDDTSPKYTDQEERNLINDQIVKSQGFDVDFSKFRCLFDFYPAFLVDENHSTMKTETDWLYFGRLAQEAIAYYNSREGTSFEFVEIEKANVYSNSGFIYFITFVAKDSCDKTKVFQAKVCNVLCREIEHSFCRLKPGQQECDEDSKRVVKKPRYTTRSNKRADVVTNVS